MTQSGGPVRISLRATPHRPFILGYPGIPPAENRDGATVQGTVEVRTVTQPVKAKWVRVEVRKYETVKGGPAPPKGTPAYTHVGKVHLLWKAGEGKEYEVVPNRDFRFVIPLPIEDLPPSLDNKRATISYELVASICYKQKGGLFRKSSPTQTTTSEHLRIIRYDLMSAWPKYQASTQQVGQSQDGSVSLVVERPQQAFGPGDSVFLMTLLRSNSPRPITFQALDVSLVEMFTAVQSQDGKSTKKSKKPPGQPTTKTEVVTSKRFTINQTIRPGEEKAFKGSLVVPVPPATEAMLTVRGAKTLGIEYKIVVQAICDNGNIVVEQPCDICASGKQASTQFVRDLGYVPGLSESQRGMGPLNSLSGQMFKSSPQLSDPSSSATSLSNKMQNGAQPPTPYQAGGPQAAGPSQPANGPIAGRLGAAANTITGLFPRRSSSTTTSTTTTSDWGPAPSDRQFTTMPTPNPASRSNTASPPAVESLRDKPLPGNLTHSKSNKWRPTDGAISESPTAAGQANAVASGSGTSTPTPAHPGAPVGAPPGYAHAGANGSAAPGQFASAAQEKDIQRQRYEEAQNRVGGPSQASGSSSYAAPAVAAAVAGVAGAGAAAALGHSHSSSLSNVNGQYPTAGQEKDRLRYEAAVANRDAASGAPTGSSAPPPGPDEAPISYEELFGNGTAAGSSSAADGSVAASSSSRAGPPPGGQPSAVAESYMSAAQEKEMMRKRYEDATNRVTRATGVPLATSPSPPPSNAGHNRTPSQTPQQTPNQTPQKPYMSAAEEKEMMRKRYEEATNKVARATGVGSGSSSDRAQSPPMSQAPAAQSPEQKLYMSAAEEKEMMRRRYEEATNRVASATGSPAAAAVASGSGGRAGTASPTPQRENSVPAAYMSAAEEKEMMRRRYEEATRRVASTTGAPVDGVAGGSSGSNGSAQPAAQPVRQQSAGSPPPASVPAAYMSAAEEKEMMRRRYEEATNRVARATSPSDSGVPSGAPPAFEDVVDTPPAQSSSTPAAYMTAAQEKEMMRQRFEEAQSRVASGSGGSGSQRPADPRQAPPIQIPGNSPPRPLASQSQQKPYLSAEEEKEMMRRRYEEATTRVARATNSVSPPPGPSASSGVSAPTSYEDAIRTPRDLESPEPEPGVSTLPPQLPPISLLGDTPTSPLATINGRYSFLGAASPSVPLESTPTKARPLTHLPTGPAPPVPTRPPQDYIDNLV